MSRRGTMSSSLALAGDAAHRREAPRLARRLDRLAHDGDVARSPRRCSRRRTRRSASRDAVRPCRGRRRSVSVAPWWRACASRSSDRSTAMMRSAPARRAPITAPRPTSPQPNTATVEPGCTFAVYSAAPIPVESPHANTARAGERRVRADLGERDLGHHGRLGEGRGAHEVAQRLAAAATGASCRRGGSRAPCRSRIAMQRFVRGLAAVDALAALGREQRHDVVARAQRA